jgi:hypothetical protein
MWSCSSGDGKPKTDVVGETCESILQSELHPRWKRVNFIQREGRDLMYLDVRVAKCAREVGAARREAREN